MKADLDRLMAERNLDALLIAGGEGYSVVRDYMSNGAEITGGVIIKVRDGETLLVVNGMEVEEARKSGLRVLTYGDLNYVELVKTLKDTAELTAAFWTRCLEASGMTQGRIGLYGEGEINVYIELARRLPQLAPQFEFVGETGRTLFDEAFITKDSDEMARIRSVAEHTNAVLEETWNFIAGHRLQDSVVINNEGEPLTIGAVKAFVRGALLERGLEDTGMIFAQGRDAGFPHSRGEAEMALRAGQSIVFDLFPRELGGGYHHDVTRTWCIGYAPPEVQAAYDDVMEAFDRSLEAFAVGKSTHLMQEVVLDSFEAKGHPTGRSNPGGMEGYVHSLGHGVGLQVHERPSISHLRQEDQFEIGNCITIEPGLYYPEKGFGVRVEDLFIITEAGELISLTPFRKDLVLPVGE